MKRIFASVMIFLAVATAVATAQNFSESPAHWKTVTVRAKGMDTIRLSERSLFTIPELSDTVPLIYYEPFPDSMMPRTSIEVAEITIQASSADEVVNILEEQARKAGADWIVGFNEPRLKWVKVDGNIKGIYRSQARLLKVIDPELVPMTDIHSIYCDANHIENCNAVLSWLDQHQQ
jgi:hypothetical protein